MTNEQTGPALFRIGGCYRARDGLLYQLRDPAPRHPEHAPEEGWAWLIKRAKEGAISAGFRRLADGCDPSPYHGSCDRTLIPGELTETGEPIADMLSGIAPPQVYEPFQPFPISEPNRAPLPSQDAGRYDSFKGWAPVTSSGIAPDEPKRTGIQRSPDLERQGHQVRPGHGSAWLVIG